MKKIINKFNIFNYFTKEVFGILIISIISYFFWPFIFTFIHWSILSLNGQIPFFKAMLWWYWLLSLFFIFITYLLLFALLNFNLAHRNHQIPNFGFYFNLSISKDDKLKAIKLNSNTYLPEANLKYHSLICGSTGMGKTNLILRLINERLKINSQAKVIFVNGKYDRNLKANLSLLKDSYKVIDSNNILISLKYNIFKAKTVEMITNLFLEYEDFLNVNQKDPSVGYYRTNEKRLTEQIFQLMKKCNIELNYANLMYYFNQNNLKTFLATKNYHCEWLYNYNADVFTAIKEKIKDIFSLACFNSNNLEYSIIDFIKDEKTKILIFNLDTDLANVINLAKIITTDIKQHLKHNKPTLMPIMVIMDEFGSFATDQIKIMNEQFRSINVEMVLSFQASNQLKNIDEQFLEDIFNNSRTMFCFQIGSPSAAEYIAKTFGTKTSYEITKQVDNNEYTGKGTKKQVEQFYVHPSDIKNKLGMGECYYRTINSNLYTTLPKKIKIDKV